MILTIVLFYFMGGEDKVNKENSQGKLYCTLMGTFIFLIGALRSTAVGYDTGQYVRHFYEISNMSWEDIIHEFGSEPGFHFLCKIISLFSVNHQILLVVVSLFVAVSITRFIYLHSEYFMVSFVMLLPMIYLGFFLTAMRQAISLCIILLSYPSIINRKSWKFILAVLLAFLFHHSAIFAIPLLFIPKTRIKPFEYIIYMLVFAVVYVNRGLILNLMLRFVYSEYEVYSVEQGTLATLFLYIGIWTTFIFFRKKSIKLDNTYFFERMLLVGIVVQSFVPLEPNIYRVAFYYLIVSLLVVPLVIKSFSRGVNRNIAVFAVLVIMFILYFGFTQNACGILPYQFFWEQNYVR